MIILSKDRIVYDNGVDKQDAEYCCKVVLSVIPYLSEAVAIESDFTLDDFFKMLEKDKDLISSLFSSYMGGVPLDPFLEEIKKDCIEEGKLDIHYLECSWTVDYFDYRLFYEEHKDKKHKLIDTLNEPSPNEETEISIGVNFGGVGKSNGVNDGYGIEFTPLYRLKHLPIRLNRTFEIFKKNRYSGKTIVKGVMDFTLFDVISEILSEITFCGYPEDRDEEWKLITDEYNEAKKNMDLQDGKDQ